MTDPESQRVDSLIIGQGLAGTALAWTLQRHGQSFVVVDHPRSETASRVSAGLLTPVTGKRLVKSDEFEAYWTTATDFYQYVERQLQQTVFQQEPMLRLFADKASRDEFLRDTEDRVRDSVESWNGTLQSGGRLQPGIQMRPAGRLQVSEYLEGSAAWFRQRQRLYHADVDITALLQQADGTGPFELSPAGTDFRLLADRVILCTGAWTSPAFPLIPDNPSRGDLLDVKIENYTAEQVVHRSVWIAPQSDGHQRIGSTYDWKYLENVPTQAGRNQVLTGVRRMVGGDIRILRHRGAVRPTMKDYQPVLGPSAPGDRVYTLNGLGSKGALRAPRLAEYLAAHLLHSEDLPVAFLPSRVRPAPSADRRPLTGCAHQRVKEILRAGDLAIDATVGNGFDTSFLAECVGAAGRVIGFDVQQSALAATAQRLKSSELTCVELRHAGHEQLADEENLRPMAVMFNLGYLPRSDKTKVTTARTSTVAIAAAMRLLAPGGILTVLCYRGHEGGPEEYRAVAELLNRHDEGYDLKRQDSNPPKPKSPVLFVVRKRSDDAET
ncbi:MAG: FAD-dependent oxidoreductase [Planctomycetaceae bacterium]|nr:FAD-dependent oxidoreductase [Planctomycetaceae bacterium]